jgi:hypothetical protein
MVFLNLALHCLLMHTNALEEAATCLFMVEKWRQPGIWYKEGRKEGRKEGSKEGRKEGHIYSPVAFIPVYHTAWCYIPEHYNLKITCVRIPNLILYQQRIEEVDIKFQKSLFQKCIFYLRNQCGIQTKNLPRHIKLSDKINIWK